LGTGTILMMTAAGLTARVLVSPQKSWSLLLVDALIRNDLSAVSITRDSAIYGKEHAIMRLLTHNFLQSNVKG
jgi:hypothetical protein